MARPDVARPDMGRPDAARPDMGRPDAARPDAARYGVEPPEVVGSLALDTRHLVWGPPGAAPDERALRLLGQALAEVLTGRRPPETVADRLTDQAYRELLRAGRMLDTRRPPFAAVPRVTEPADGVVEMCVLLHCGERSHVLAVRLERRGVQWLVTDFETA
ncbi:Rv3235 family protein [Nonomuraea rhodomycinica]|uniref:Rv3235 family protein n=1 Tax=Nonomuraea rhodomycinica TaxID=1712872 RepID=UPI0028A8DCFC|nr:Rv3235 family protein [Nonomuraea rhodomycinica]